VSEEAASRSRLRAPFDSAAASYADARPTSPDELVDALVAATGIGPGSRLLEVGCGPGTATLPLAELGCRITAVELGAGLAEEARRRLAAYPDVRVVTGAFETYPPGEHDHDLVYAATAWHWVDPEARYRRAHDVLRPDGHLAFLSASHVVPRDGDPFFREIQEVYDEIGEGVPDDHVWLGPGELPDQTAEIVASGLFDVAVVRQLDWENTYDAGSFIALLDTFSGHIAMEDAKRAHLYAEIRRRLAERPDGLLRRHWGAVLHVAAPRVHLG
jgi:SAM-dependent methyltransferase